MNTYHFDLGNSSRGAIGMCANIKADSAEDALAILKEKLEGHETVKLIHERDTYIHIYTSPHNVSIFDIEAAL